MKFITFKSLKIFLSTVVTAIVICMAIALVALSYFASYHSVESAYLNQLINTSNHINNQVSQFYDEQMENAIFFSKNRTVIDAIIHDRYDAANELFKSFSDERQLYENIFISTPENNPKILSGIAGIETRWGNAGYDDNIKNNLNGKAYISDPVKSPVTGMPVCLFSAPVKKEGSVIGILGMAVNVGDFSNQIIKGITVAKTGFPYIVTDEGITFAHPKKEFILKLDLKNYEWGNKVLHASNGEIIRYFFQGINKMIVPVKNEQYGFITGVTIDESDITEDSRSLAVKMVGFSIIAIIISILAIYFIIARRLAPLEGCRNIMKEMSEGNLSARYTGAKNNDEIGDIAEALNTTVEQFEHMISDIIIATQNLSQAVDQIASGNQNLSQRTSEQASSLEEIASTIEEATAAINQNSDNTEKAKNFTDEGAAKSSESNLIAIKAVESINEMNESSRKVVDCGF